MKTALVLTALSVALSAFAADDLAVLCTDRAAIERVYHAHRTGTKKTFDETMSRALIEQLVRQDQHKENVLRQVYGMSITPALLATEVQRITTTTRAPDVLAEIMHALGDDAARFARSMARPIIVERELRQRFGNDDKLHADQRHEAEQARATLLASKPVAGMHDVTWQLTSPAANVKSAPAQVSTTSTTYTNQSTASLAPPLAAPAPDTKLLCLADLDPQLQNVLLAQLHQPGDISAVIETLGGFLIFQARSKTTTTLTASSLSIPKRSYEQWLAQQPQ